MFHMQGAPIKIRIVVLEITVFWLWRIGAGIIHVAKLLLVVSFHLYSMWKSVI